MLIKAIKRRNWSHIELEGKKGMSPLLTCHKSHCGQTKARLTGEKQNRFT
jgi:hypothetical protein